MIADLDECIFQSNYYEKSMWRKEASLQNTAVNQFDAVWFFFTPALCCGGGLYWRAVVMQLVYQSHPI